MTANIFISYSRNDSAKALALRDRLRAEGFSVWIDQEGIGAATSWSGEIVDAIESCAVFIVLLSQTSVASEHVIREVTLAFENKRKIIPVEIEQVELPREFKYHLAGIQRTTLDKVDSIVSAILASGAMRGEAQTIPAREMQRSIETAQKKSKGIPIIFYITLSVIIIGGAAWFFLRPQNKKNITNDGFSSSVDSSWHKYGSKIPEANTLFERAMQAKESGDSSHEDEARRLLENAISLDSNFALAYINLAGTYSDHDSAGVAIARKLARKALLIDPNLPAAYAMSGFLALVDKDTAAAFEYGNRGVAISDSTSNMSWEVLRDCYLGNHDYKNAYRSEQGILHYSSHNAISSSGFYFSWIALNEDSLATLYPPQWIETWIKSYREMPQRDFLLYVIVIALDDLGDPRISEYLPKLTVKAEYDPSALTTVAFYNVHHHHDAELLKNLQTLKKKWGIPKLLTDNNRFKEYRSKPEFQEFIRIAK